MHYIHRRFKLSIKNLLLFKLDKNDKLPSHTIVIEKTLSNLVYSKFQQLFVRFIFIMNE